MTLGEIAEHYKTHPGYHKKGLQWLADYYGISSANMYKIRKDIYEYSIRSHSKSQPISKVNTLFVGDLHTPFMLDGYEEFAASMADKYNCDNIIFAGDIIDGHSWSYHEHDVDGMSVGDELDAAIDQLHRIYKLFPKAISLMGNHDLLIQRKAKTAGLSSRFIKSFNKILKAPEGWEFKHEHIQDRVRYIHGSIGDAFKVAKDTRISTVQGHLHSKAFVQWSVSQVDAIFGLQVGCGIDHHAYAFEYAKPLSNKPIISVGVILDNGRLPLLELMPL